MKNKLIFRILGALSSALIIVSVFVPFVKVTGYSQSLWQTNVNTIYLPIIIIAFGAIGVLLFATNLKTELAYSTTGALLFFLITQSIPIINQGTFGTLNVGYYFLVVGTLLTGIMTFLCGLKPKQKVVEETKVEEVKEDSMINQIDRLYDNQTVQTNENEINQVEMIQPLQSTDVLQPISQNNNSLNMPIEEESENLNDLLQPSVQVNSDEDIKIEETPIVEESFEQPTIVEEKQLQPSEEVTNPVVSEFAVPSESVMPTVQPAQEQFPTVNTQPSEEVTNPVVSEFASPSESVMPTVQPTQEQFPTVNAQPSEEVTNPVVSEFAVPSQFNIGVPTPQPSVVEEKQEGPIVEPLQALQPLGTPNKVDVMADQNTVNESNNSNLDIFG